MEKGTPNNLGSWAGALQVYGIRKCQLCGIVHILEEKYEFCCKLLTSSKPSWKLMINHMSSFGSPPSYSTPTPPSSLPSQANKQLEPRQNTSSHTKDPAPSHADLLHPDLHLAVPLDVAQHSNNRRSSGARQSPLSFPLRDINRWQVPVDQQHPSRFHHAPTASAPTARPDSGFPIPSGWVTSSSYRATQMP